MKCTVLLVLCVIKLWKCDFLALFMRRFFPKRECTLDTKLRSIHHFKGLNKSDVQVRLIHAKLWYLISLKDSRVDPVYICLFFDEH